MAPHDSLKDVSAREQQHDVDQNVPGLLHNNIPIIDFAGLDGPERSNICQQIAEACETWGFFHLINHGIDRSLIKRAKDVSMEFFHGTEEEKVKIKVQAGPQMDGWANSKHLVEGNKLIEKDTAEYLFNRYYPERQEYFDRVPQQPASYTSTMLEYTKQLEFLGEKLLGILSEMLAGEPKAMKSTLTASSASQSLYIAVRTNFYGLNDDGDALPGICHAHSDPGALTVLLADDAPGLEVRKNGRWVKVDPISGGLIINVGDMVEICSNGRYKSLEHRGLPSYKQERLTVATFVSPEMDAVVGPIQSLLDENHPPLYKTSTFAAYLADFMAKGLEGKGGLERHKLQTGV